MSTFADRRPEPLLPAIAFRDSSPHYAFHALPRPEAVSAWGVRTHPMTCFIRRAVPSDAAAACEVVRRSIVELCYDDHRDDEPTLAEWLANKTPANFERWITSEQHVAFVAESEGVPVGFGLLNLQGTIALLYVSPDVRFRGISKALLAALEAEAIVSGIRELKLESSTTALRFYTRSGYSSTGPPCKGIGISTCHPMSRQIEVAG